MLTKLFHEDISILLSQFCCSELSNILDHRIQKQEYTPLIALLGGRGGNEVFIPLRSHPTPGFSARNARAPASDFQGLYAAKPAFVESRL